MTGEINVLALQYVPLLHWVINYKGECTEFLSEDSQRSQLVVSYLFCLKTHEKKLYRVVSIAWKVSAYVE